MKIFYSLPENMDKGDVYILGIVRIGVLGFLAISSLTVFKGFKSYSADYMNSIWPVAAAILLFLGYWAFCFVPDFVNTMIVRYISRTILKKTYQGDKRTYFVLAFSLCLVVFLTRYSYKMSHFSAEVTAREMGGDTENTDLVAFDSIYQQRFDKLQTAYETEKAEIITRYDQLVTEAAGELDFKIKGEETLIAGLEQNRKKTNTVWTDQQVRLHQRRIANYQKRRKPIASPIRAEQQKELNTLKETFDLKYGRLDQAYTITRDTTLAMEGTAGDIHKEEVNFFSKQLSSIAGNAIFFLLMLTIIREIIYDRNDIDPDPVFSQFDFQPSVVMEVITFPFTYIGRSILNEVRKGYNALPELIQREDYQELTDPGQRQKVRKAKTTETQKPGIAEERSGETTETPPLENEEIERDENTENTEISEAEIEGITEVPKSSNIEITEFREKDKLRNSVKAEDTSKSRPSSRKPISVKRGKEADEITEIEKANDGTVLKVRIGYKWYTFSELGKRIYDFRNLAETASKETTRQRNLRKIEVFERARRLFQNEETPEVQKNGKHLKDINANSVKIQP